MSDNENPRATTYTDEQIRIAWSGSRLAERAAAAGIDVKEQKRRDIAIRASTTNPHNAPRAVRPPRPTIKVVDTIPKTVQELAPVIAAHNANQPNHAQAAQQGGEVEVIPTRHQINSTLKARAKKLRSSNRPSDTIEGDYITKILDGDSVADSARDVELAVQAIVKNAPHHSPDDDLHRIVLDYGRRHSANLLQLIAEARVLRATAEASPDGFRRIMKPGVRFGEIENGQHNVRLALEKLGVSLRYDTFSDQEIIVRDGKTSELDDANTNALYFEIEREYEFKPEYPDFVRLVSVVARENSYHPVVEYLAAVEGKELPEDLSDLPATWLIRYGGAEDTPYTRAVSQLMLVAAVRRVRQPGCLFHEMLVLESVLQGVGKSSVLEALPPNPDWFTDSFDLAKTDDKSMREQTTGFWIIEAGELGGLNRADTRSLKQTQAKRMSRARMSYDRKASSRPFQHVTFATTNDGQYLRDPTGNRRTWPMQVTAIDVEGLIKVRDFLWCAAARLETAGESIRLDPSLYEAAAAEQAARRVMSPIEILLREALGDRSGRIAVSDVWPLARVSVRTRPTNQDSNDIRDAMIAMGWHQPKNPVAIQGRKTRVWARGQGPDLVVREPSPEKYVVAAVPAKP